MDTNGIARRMSVLAGALPLRILIVDDDELELALISDQLTTAGFDVTRAMNGDEALSVLSERWFPVVITDWQMPVMDGIAFTEALRARGNSDTYVIMLTMREGSMDYERGYHSGVNDYLTKKLPDAELFARISAAFNTIALRRSLDHAQTMLQNSATIDISGAFSIPETLAKLTSETVRGQRYGRSVTTITIGVAAVDGGRRVELETIKGVVKVLQRCIRAHVDWVGRLAAPSGATLLAVVLPEAGAAQVVLVQKRIRDALSKFSSGSYGGERLQFSFGAASFQRDSSDDKSVSAADLISVAEKCRACPGHKGPEQLLTVQSSVGSGAAIVCRHGYSVDEYCTLKIDALVEYAPRIGDG